MKYKTYPTALAFPVATSTSTDPDFPPGLNKREYFAAMAMQGYIAAGSNGMPEPSTIAALSSATADALIAELNKAKP